MKRIEETADRDLRDCSLMPRLVIATLFNEPADVTLVADPVVKPFAPGSAAGEHQRRIKLVQQ